MLDSLVVSLPSSLPHTRLGVTGGMAAQMSTGMEGAGCCGV